MKLTREEYMASIASIIGDRTDDEALKFVEDMTDTFDGNVNTEYEETINNLNATIKELTDKNNTIEEEWRKKYLARFYGGSDEEIDPSNQNVIEDETMLDGNENITIDDLFKETPVGAMYSASPSQVIVMLDK